MLLAEAGLHFDSVAGTSIGALNGAFYVQGDGSAAHAEALCGLWRDMANIDVIQTSGPAMPRAVETVFARRQPAVAVLVNLFAAGSHTIPDPEQMEDMLDRWIDCEAVCTSTKEFVVTVLPSTNAIIDIAKGPWSDATYLSARDLGPEELKNALLASAAIPLAFPSKKVRGRRFSDAGLADTLPTQELYRRGARWIVSMFLSDQTPQNRADYAGANVVQIRPSEVIDHRFGSTFDRSRSSIERLIDLGYRDAGAVVGEIWDVWERIASLRARSDENVALADSLPDWSLK